MMYLREVPRQYGPSPIGPEIFVARTTLRRLSEELFRFARAVEVRGVEEGDTLLDCLLYDGLRVRSVDARAGNPH
jgi:hypothetical protein